MDQKPPPPPERGPQRKKRVKYAIMVPTKAAASVALRAVQSGQMAGSVFGLVSPVNHHRHPHTKSTHPQTGGGKRIGIGSQSPHPAFVAGVLLRRRSSLPRRSSPAPPTRYILCGSGFALLAPPRAPACPPGNPSKRHACHRPRYRGNMGPDRESQMAGLPRVIRPCGPSGSAGHKGKTMPIALDLGDPWTV